MFLTSFNQVFPNLQICMLFFPNFVDSCTIFSQIQWLQFQIGRKIPDSEGFDCKEIMIFSILNEFLCVVCKGTCVPSIILVFCNQ